MMRKLIARLFKRGFKPPFQTDHIIKEAFECGGIQYYQFDDTSNMPYERALHALAYYEELKMRCTHDFLKAHCTAVTNLLSDPRKIDIGRLAMLNTILKDRLEWIVEPDQVYKLASVLFFDKNESPFNYDFKYNHKKIAAWKAAEGADAFFLRQPIKSLIPFLQTSDVNSQTYSQVAETLHQAHLTSILSLLSDDQKQAEHVKSLLSQEETRPS